MTTKKVDVNKSIREIQEKLISLPADKVDNEAMMNLINMSVQVMRHALTSRGVTSEDKLRIANSVVLKAINKDLVITHDVGENFLEFVKQANQIKKEAK